MKRMVIVIVIFIAVAVGGGLYACGRGRGSKPGPRTSPAIQTPRGLDGLKLDTHPDYPGDTAEKRALLRRLKREERRQRPQEGRN